MAERDRARGRRRGSAIGASLLVLLASCSGSLGRDPGSSPTTTVTSTTLAPTGKPIDPALIGVTLDPDGRPYDATFGSGAEVEWQERRLTTLAAPGGRIAVIGGEYLLIGGDLDGATIVRLGAERLVVSAIRPLVDGELAAEVGGLRIARPGSRVVRWGPFEVGYGTDGGMGGVAAAGLADGVSDDPTDDASQAVYDSLDATGSYVADADGDEGTDLVVFDNGYGDGEFPLSRGFDEQGRLVAVMVWTTTTPWRLAVPDGTPPRDVTEREDELQACLDGRRGLSRLDAPIGRARFRCPSVTEN